MGTAPSILSKKKLDDKFLSSVRFLPFSILKKQGKLVEKSENRDSLVYLKQIINEETYNSSLFIFISHKWLRPDVDCEDWEGSANPDNVKGEKYDFLIKGLETILSSYCTNEVKECYLWIDYCCLNQKRDSMDKVLPYFDHIIEICDFLYTPLIEVKRKSKKLPTTEMKLENSSSKVSSVPLSSVHPESKPEAKENNVSEVVVVAQPHVSQASSFLDKVYSSPSWSGNNDSYLTRSWCRLELFLGANIPLFHKNIKEEETNNEGKSAKGKEKPIKGEDPLQVDKVKGNIKTREEKLLKGELLTQYKSGRRGHFLYGNQEKGKNQVPIAFPLLDSALFLKEYSAVTGALTTESDRKAIIKLAQSSLLPPELRIIPSEKKEKSIKENSISNKETPSNSSGSSKDESNKNEQKGKGFDAGSPTKSSAKKDVSKTVDAKADGKTATKPSVPTVPSLSFNLKIEKDPFLLTSPHLYQTKNEHYEGKRMNGEKTGFGKLINTITGDSYEGEFQNDLFHGKGRYYQKSTAKVYEGQFEKGLMTGYGIEESVSSSSISSSEPVTEKKTDDDNVAAVIDSSYRYEGHFQNGLPHGFGKYRYPDQTIYEGNFADGVRSGDGRLSYPDGIVYEGTFQNDKKHGEGKLIYPGGKVILQTWNHGVSLKESKKIENSIYGMALLTQREEEESLYIL
jgi:hypothetical protein